VSWRAARGVEGGAGGRPRVSACVVARDAERTLELCLASLAFADERVVIVDERSCDATESIAISEGARVIRRAYAGNVEQKNYALDCAGGDWVLVVDADEALSPELARNVMRWLESRAGAFDGAELGRKTLHLGRWLEHGDFHPDCQLRLFRRERGRFSGANPHGRVRVEGRIAKIDGCLEHRSYANLADQIERVREFSAIEAVSLCASGRRVRWTDLALRPAARFLRAYVLNQGFRDGFAGFAVAVVSAFHVLVKYASVFEREQHGVAPREAAAASARAR